MTCGRTSSRVLAWLVGAVLVSAAGWPAPAMACHTYLSPVDGAVGCGPFRRDRAAGDTNTDSGGSPRSAPAKPDQTSSAPSESPPSGGGTDTPDACTV